MFEAPTHTPPRRPTLVYRPRRETIVFDGRSFTFDASPIFEGWEVAVYDPAKPDPLITFEFWNDGLRAPLSDPILGGLAREVMDFLLPPAKLRHVTAEAFEREVRVYTTNRRRAITSREAETLSRLARYAKEGEGFDSSAEAAKAAGEVAGWMGYETPDEVTPGSIEGAVLVGVMARAKLAARGPVTVKELRVLARLSPGPFELPRKRVDGLVPWSIARKVLVERGALR